MKRKPNTSCSVCKKPIYRRPLQILSGNVYCSLACCGVHQRSERKCHVCGKLYLGAKKTCSRGCANKARSGMRYVGVNEMNKARQGTLQKERIAKKRGGKCERCGERNYAILQIHHKMERSRGGTNKPSNLELLCPNCHAAEHLGVRLFQNNKSGKVLRHKK